jgi:NhaP-type Na+/H+ or K+/H+ antiporter
MMVDVVLVATGVLGLIVAAASSKLRQLPLSEPVLGLAVGILLGPYVLDVLRIPLLTEESPLLHEVSRLLLAVSVMAVALRYSISDARRDWRPVALLLVVVMPAMAVVSAGLGWAIVGLPLAAAVLFGAAISPTDPVLASSVVTGDLAERDLPARNRRILSLESGANDGLALPLVVAALAVAGAISTTDAVTEALWQVLGALVIGALIGGLAGRVLRIGEEYGATDTGPALFFTVVLALGILGTAGLAGVDGILAVFVGGLAFNAVATGRERAAEVPIDEAVNRFAVLPLFVLLGAALPWPQWGDLGWGGPILVAAVLLLRRLPLLLVLRRPLRLSVPDALYLGWFGPVGVSALFYLTLEAKRLDIDETVLSAGSLVLACSTVAFGVSGVFGRLMYRCASGRAGSAADPSG